LSGFEQKTPVYVKRGIETLHKSWKHVKFINDNKNCRMIDSRSYNGQRDPDSNGAAIDFL